MDALSERADFIIYLFLHGSLQCQHSFRKNASTKNNTTHLPQLHPTLEAN